MLSGRAGTLWEGQSAGQQAGRQVPVGAVHRHLKCWVKSFCFPEPWSPQKCSEEVDSCSCRLSRSSERWEGVRWNKGPALFWGHQCVCREVAEEVRPSSSARGLGGPGRTRLPRTRDPWCRTPSSVWASRLKTPGGASSPGERGGGVSGEDRERSYTIGRTCVRQLALWRFLRG